MKTIKELRKENGYNQSDLARKVGVSRSTIAMWESGKSNPDPSALLSLADIFSVSVDYLLGKEEREQVEESPAKKFVESLPLDLLTDDELEKLVEYAEFLVSQRKKKEYE